MSKKRITAYIDEDLLEFCREVALEDSRESGRRVGYQTALNDIIRQYMNYYKGKYGKTNGRSSEPEGQ